MSKTIRHSKLETFKEHFLEAITEKAGNNNPYSSEQINDHIPDFYKANFAVASKKTKRILNFLLRSGFIQNAGIYLFEYRFKTAGFIDPNIIGKRLPAYDVAVYLLMYLQHPEYYYAGTTFENNIPNITQQYRVEYVIECQHNQYAMLLEHILTTIGFETSKGSGRKCGSQNSKFVYIRRKEDWMINLAQQVQKDATSGNYI